MIAADRIRLRRWSTGDRQVMTELLTDAEVRRFLGGPVEIARVDRAIGQMRHSAEVFAVEERANSRVVGSVSLDRHRGELEVSFTFLPVSWGQGLASEAVRELLRYAWSAHDDDSIIAITQTANAASRRLLDRLGFVEANEFEEFGAPQTMYRVPRPAQTPGR